MTASRVSAEIGGFNPRAREGRDYACRSAIAAWRVSIHAPARGATAAPNEEMENYEVSIHAPARGATSNACVKM